MNATLAVVLGTLAGTALVRFRAFRGRSALALMIGAPLVMPDVILGLASLLLFVAMEQLIGWPAGRGDDHDNNRPRDLSMAYVAVIVQSRLVRLDPSLEEAAMDLGARPWKVFFVITLPLIASRFGGRLAACVHAVARRPGNRQLYLGAGCLDPADGGLFERTPGRQSGNQRPGDLAGEPGDHRNRDRRLVDAAPGPSGRA